MFCSSSSSGVEGSNTVITSPAHNLLHARVIHDFSHRGYVYAPARGASPMLAWVGIHNTFSIKI